MTWGFGSIGYGPHRTREILGATPDASERLARVAGTLAEVGPLAAYRRLAREDDSRIAGLGPAFGTKYLYFCQPRPAETTALILDAFVSEWLRCEARFRLNPVGWSEPTYRRYLEQMPRWADALDCAPDALEPASSSPRHPVAAASGPSKHRVSFGERPPTECTVGPLLDLVAVEVPDALLTALRGGPDDQVGEEVRRS